jgi:CspA family cold shock protein
MTTGAVRWFDVPKGYGLIKPDDGGVDVLVDICAVERAEMATLKQGQRLNFEIVHDERIGRSYAENLIASEIRTPPLNALSPITPLHHDRRAIQRPQAPTVKTRFRPSIQSECSARPKRYWIPRYPIRHDAGESYCARLAI